jgi:undecaprenyl diphosphate synthase
MKALLEILKPGDAERPLAEAVDPDRIPRHIAVIMDGNGRWAHRRGLPRLAGHKAGANAVRSTVETCAQLGVGALTLYAFSIENWKRPRPEVESLWRLLRVYLRRELPALVRNGIRFGAVGRLARLPDEVRRELDYVAAATAANRGMRLHLALNYGGRAEIVDAVQALRRDGVPAEAIDEAAISSRLYAPDVPDPDLLIRTSGEMRVSNFLLWQIAYAELYVTETLWPDFDRAGLLAAILDFQKRERRFGGLNAEPEVTEPLDVSR